MVDKNDLISNKREWDNCFIKNDRKISRILPDFICKNNRFSACVFNFERIRTVTIFGEHGNMTIMAHISNDSVFNKRQYQLSCFK